MAVRDRVVGRWGGTDLADMLGRKFYVGDKVAKACQSSRAVNISICEVSKIEDGKLYLNESKVAVVYPGRLLIVNEVVK